jgi:anti-sigma factor RsiW
MHGSDSNRSCVTTCNLTRSGALYASLPLSFPGFPSLFSLLTLHLYFSGSSPCMTTCPRSERLVALFHDGELDSPLRREMASHVAGCIVCTRTLAALGRVQELVVQTISEQVEETDFSDFWEGVASKLDQQTPLSWRLWLQLWRERLRLTWLPDAPVWAATVAALLIVSLLVSYTPSSKENGSASRETPPTVLAANDQAQIESLSSTATVFLWNEPEGNATVIWVSDDNEGGMP